MGLEIYELVEHLWFKMEVVKGRRNVGEAGVGKLEYTNS